MGNKNEMMIYSYPKGKPLKYNNIIHYIILYALNWNILVNAGK